MTAAAPTAPWPSQPHPAPASSARHAAEAARSPPASTRQSTPGCCSCTPTQGCNQAGDWPSPPTWRLGPERAGYFRFVLDSTNPKARRLEQLVAWRSRALGLPYGDQGLLIHRSLLSSVGGMKPLPLMEDVDLVRRLGRARLVALPAVALTSAARWERDGYLSRSANNLLCLSLWFAGVPPRLIRRLYE